MKPKLRLREFALGWAALSLAASLPAFGQTAKPEPSDGPITTLTAQARLVNLPVVVRDKKGALVQTLTRDDFVLKVDDKAQTIRYFDQDANLPLTLGLLVDVSESQRSVIDEEQTASETFLDKMLLSDRDKAFVIQFARQTELLQDVTPSRPKLKAALKEIGTTSSNSSNSSNNNSTDSNDSNDHGSSRRGGTVLYDAAFLAADEVMKPLQGRKALIVLTDGVDRGSRETLNRAIEKAQRSDTIVYAIYFKGEAPRNNNNNQQRRSSGFPGFPGGGGGYPGGGGGYPGGGGGYPGGGSQRGGGNNGGGGGGGSKNIDGKRVLEQMTAETGGRLFEVKKKGGIAEIYTQIGEELRAQYRLGYSPDATMAAEGYHQIDLAMKDVKKGYVVQTRDGYYSGK